MLTLCSNLKAAEGEDVEVDEGVDERELGRQSQVHVTA